MLQDHKLDIANMIYLFIHCDIWNGMFDDNMNDHMNDPPMGFQKNFFRHTSSAACRIATRCAMAATDEDMDFHNRFSRQNAALGAETTMRMVSAF